MKYGTHGCYQMVLEGLLLVGPLLSSQPRVARSTAEQAGVPPLTHLTFRDDKIHASVMKQMSEDSSVSKVAFKYLLRVIFPTPQPHHWN